MCVYRCVRACIGVRVCVYRCVCAVGVAGGIDISTTALMDNNNYFYFHIICLEYKRINLYDYCPYGNYHDVDDCSKLLLETSDALGYLTNSHNNLTFLEK